MQEIVIYFRKRAFVSLAVVATIATLIFAWLYVDRMEHRVRGQIDVLKSVYLALTAGSAVLMVRAFGNILSKKPGMIINDKGVTDYLNLNGTVVAWENILKAEVTKFGPQKVMAVYVNNASDLTANMKKIKQTAANAKIKKLGTPVMISTNAYDFDVEATIAIINNKAGAR